MQLYVNNVKRTTMLLPGTVIRGIYHLSYHHLRKRIQCSGEGQGLGGQAILRVYDFEVHEFLA